MADLLPCPFCGGVATARAELRDGCQAGEPDAWCGYCFCRSCAAQGPWAKAHDRENAIRVGKKAWSRRVATVQAGDAANSNDNDNNARGHRINAGGWCSDCGSGRHDKLSSSCNPPPRPLTESTWTEFAEAGLFWWVNRGLHLFGWALVREVHGYGTPEERVARVYPARCRFRGFDEHDEADGFRKLTKHMRDNAGELVKQTDT